MKNLLSVSSHKKAEDSSTNEDSEDKEDKPNEIILVQQKRETRRKNMRGLERRKMFTAMFSDFEPTTYKVECADR